VQSVALPLDYNIKTSSYNAFRRDANFDGKGNSYASELLPDEISFKGINFKLAAGDVPNGLKCKQNTINLPKGNFTKLYLLAASTQGDNKVEFLIDGKAQEAVIPDYTGFIGQWGHTGHTDGFLKSADVAFVGTHKHNMIQNRDLPYEYTYMFIVALDLPKNAKQVILPNNSRIVIFAGTLTTDENNRVTPVTDLLNVNLKDLKSADELYIKKDLINEKPVIERSGETGAREKAEYAVDGEMYTKWCDRSADMPKYLVVDLGKEETIRGWYVLHAGLESLDYITKEYSLQVKLNKEEEWQTIDVVSNNSALETERLLQTSQTARYIRLHITKPDQSDGQTARIYEFQVY
jgi:alpha-mannosidase